MSVDGNTFVLLGAGASVPAGIPTTNEMTSAFLAGDPEVLSERDKKTLRFIAGGIQQRRGVEGENPFQSINIEELFDTLTKLADRKSLNVAPFVAQWHPNVDEADRIDEGPDIDDFEYLEDTFQRVEDALKEALEDPLEPPGPPTSVDGIAVKMATELCELLEWSRSVSLNPSRGGFDQTGDHMLRALADFVWLDDQWKTQYLDPLVNWASEENATIATLNYDNTVELAAERMGKELKIGLQEWNKKGELTKPRSGIELLKLHGSIDWVRKEERPSVSSERSPEMLFPSREVSRLSADKPVTKNRDPELIFGAGNKLTEEGPFLELFRVFEERLQKCKSLVVIGYSFSDEHIDHFIRRWMNQGPDRNMRIVDHPDMKSESHPLWQRHRGLRKSDRVKLLNLGAEDGIQKLFADTP